MITQIVFKNGVELLVDHDAPPTFDRPFMKELYTARTHDGKLYRLMFNPDEVLYEKTYDNWDDYLDARPL